jgi:transposase
VPCWWKLPRYQTISGPLHAFFVRARRGHQIAAVARKLTVRCWHLLTEDKDYLWARPALVASKTRVMELLASHKGNQPGQPMPTT